MTDAQWDACNDCGHYRKDHKKKLCDHLFTSDERCICSGFREEPRDTVDRYHDAMTSGGRRVDAAEWNRLLARARFINEREHAIMAQSLFDDAPLSTFNHVRREILPELHIAVPYRVILNLEASFAELDMLATEMERVGKEVLDEAYRRKMQNTIDTVRKTIEDRKRSHLKVIP